MVDEKKGGFFARKNKEEDKKKKKGKEEAKIMEEPKAKTMEEPEAMVMEEPVLSEPKVMDSKVKALDSNPIMRRKHKDVVGQRSSGARKYFRSR